MLQYVGPCNGLRNRRIRELPGFEESRATSCFADEPGVE